MDIEFHYYVTFIAALRAGFKPEDAYLLSYSSQYVDDNTRKFIISKNTADEYNNYKSQTIDITKPEKDLMRIYPIFHFMPGNKEEIESGSASRKDGKYHVLNTIPDNSNAQEILKEALKTRDLYRIGIATHMYADTFAHQNFVGYYESFNGMKGILEKVIPDVGHADAQHSPDLPGLIWEDLRLIRRNSTVDNKERFITAAAAIFVKFRKYVDPACPATQVLRDKAALTTEIEKAIGNHDEHNENRKNRINCYKEAIGKNFKEYDENGWFDETVNKGFLAPINPWATYKWKPNYKDSNWYKFQEAVKTHQWFAMDNVITPITADLELERF